MKVKNVTIDYKCKTALVNDVSAHFSKCQNDFLSGLKQKVNMDEYCQKIIEQSFTFEAWDKNELIGLIAAYFNNFDTKIGFITSVSLLPEYQGMGVASVLLENCINYAIENEFNSIKLEVNKNNVSALKLYKKFNFVIVAEYDSSVLMAKKL